MKKVIIFGASYAARMMRVYLDREREREVVGFAVDEAFLNTTEFDGLPVFAWERLDKHYAPDEAELLGPITHREMNALRRNRHREAKERGYTLASFIHPTAQIYASHLGEASIILEYNIIQPGTWIGDGFISWSGTLVGHDCHIGDYCFLSGAVSVGGHSNLGDRVYLAGAARIGPGTKLGEASAVLNGAYLAVDLPAFGVVKGPDDKPLRVKTDRVHKLF